MPGFVSVVLATTIQIDQLPRMLKNIDMSTETRKSQTEEASDFKAVISHAFHGKPLDPDIANRVREQAEAIRERLPLTNVAVDLIREGRDEE